MGEGTLKSNAKVENSQAFWFQRPEGLLCKILKLIEEYAQRALMEMDHDACVEYLMATRILFKLLRPFGEIRIKVEFRPRFPLSAPSDSDGPCTSSSA